jgi:serine/threonine protein kinase
LLVPRDDLYKAIVESSEITETHAKAIMLPLLSAFEYNHEKGIYHRNIISDNISVMSNTFQDIVLDDFGCAIHIDHQKDGRCDSMDDHAVPELWDFQSYIVKAYTGCLLSFRSLDH